MADDTPSESRTAGSPRVTLVVCLLLVLAAAAAGWLIYNTQPEAQRSTQTRETAMLVEVTEAERGDFRPRIVALGTVEAARTIQLSPRISGQVTERSRAFTPGGFLEEGEMLLEIDPADYRNALRQRESELSQARADLELEMGRQKIAESDFELLDELDGSVAAGSRELVLRQPQLDTARARIESAEAAVEQAELDLDRTSIEAPFKLQVIERNVDVGSQVAPGDDLGRLIGVETYWVTTTVPLAALPWIEFGARDEGGGSAVAVRNRSAWPEGVTREGRVERLIGTLNDETRLARVLVTVDDPLALEPEHEDAPALLLGSVLESEITGREIRDVVRLDRSLLREGGTVWVMDEEDRLRIAEIEVAFQDARYAYVSEGLADDDRIVTSNLATVSDGAALRLEGGAE